MTTTVCPRCGKHVLHSPGEGPTYCDAVSCGFVFAPLEQERSLPPRKEEQPEAEAPVIPELPPPPEISAPQLVAPHVCPRCQGEIHQPSRKRWTTITHECGNRTDLVAVIFRAPCCGAYLELPRAQTRRNHRCPACPQSFLGPRDDIIHRRAADLRPGAVMRFRCTNPECGRRLQCNTHHDGETTAGQSVVCPACIHVLTVPSAGEAVSR